MTRRAPRAVLLPQTFAHLTKARLLRSGGPFFILGAELDGLDADLDVRVLRPARAELRRPRAS